MSSGPRKIFKEHRSPAHPVEKPFCQYSSNRTSTCYCNSQAFFIVKLLIGILQYLHSMLYLSTSYCQANSFRENRNSSKWLSIFLSYRGYWMNVRGIRILSFLDGGISLGRALQRYNSYPEAATQCCPY